MRSGRGFRRCCRAKKVRRVRRPKTRACLWKPCSGGPARCEVSWRDLPVERFGPWHTVYARFRRWRQAGVWPQVLAQVQNATGLHQLMINSTTVRAH
jgi:hypothetical protein